MNETLTARCVGMASLDVLRVTHVVALLLFACGVGRVLVSGEAKSHIKNLLYCPPLTSFEVDQPTNGRLLVFGDSRDWFIWSDWCTLQAFKLTRVCTEFDRAIPCSSREHTDLICLRPDGTPAVIMWLFYGVDLLLIM